MLTHDTIDSRIPEEPVSQVRLRVAPAAQEEEQADVAPAPMPTRADILAYMPIVETEVARFLRRLPRSVLRDDLISAGTIGLLDALRKNRGERDARFEHYVRIRVRGAILDELRREDWLSRGDRAKERANESAAGIVHLEDLAETGRETASGDESPDDVTERHLRLQAVSDALEALPSRERELIELYYVRGWMAKDIARTMGVSEPRVSQLHAQAVGRLRQHLAAWRKGATLAPPACAAPSSVHRVVACKTLPLRPANESATFEALARLVG